MNFKGTIIRIEDEVQVSEKFRKPSFVISDKESQYPQVLEFQCTQDRCSLVDKLYPGAIVNVHFNLRGKEWTNKEGKVIIFLTLDAWKLDIDGQVNHENAAGPTSAPPASNTPEDDLPF